MSGRTLFASVVCLATVTRLGALFYSRFVLDDAYITLRVARNIAAGNGFVYNVGEHVQACSSPLWGVITAALWLAFKNHALLVAQSIGGLCDALVAGLITLLLAPTNATRAAGAQRTSTYGALLAGCFYAGLSTSVLIVTGGLETGLYVLVIALTLYLVAERRWSAASCCGGVAVLVRPDGAAVALTVLVFAALARKRMPWRQLALTSVVVTPYLVFAEFYYGGIVPQSALAKSRLMRSSAEEWASLGRKWVWGSPVQWVLFSLFAVGLWAAVANRRNLRPLAFWLSGFAIAFSSFASWWPWYWPPAMFGYAVLAGLGFDVIIERVSTHLTPKALGVAGSVLCIVVGAAVTTKSAMGARDNRAHMALALPYSMKMGHRLAQLTSPDDTIMTEPLGLLGFFSDRTFRDFPGLAAPSVSDAIKAFGGPVHGKPDEPAAMRFLLRRVRPTVLVLREDEYDALQKAGVLGNYSVVEKVPLNSPPSNGLQTMYVLRLAATAHG